MTRPLKRPDVEIVWRPQAGPQHSLVTCPVSEIFFGGARGGGKTDGVLGKWAVKAQKYGRGFNARMFRKTQVSSEDAIERSKQIYGPLGGRFNETTKIWRMPHGGRVGFAYLESVDDAQAQQGKNLSDAWVEEAGQYLSPDPIDRLFGALRSAENVPVQLILTANPGGAGQHWLAKRYALIPFPLKPRLMTRILPNGVPHEYAVIPSRLTDNKIMIESDPQYINRLQLVGSEQLVRAWLDGDWSAIEGAFFPEWNPNQHVIPPFNIPDDWTRFRSADWGSAHPFSIGWWAVAGEDAQFNALGHHIYDTEKSFVGFGPKSEPEQRDVEAVTDRVVAWTIPRGAIIRYREWYGALKPNVGLKLPAEDVGDGIVEREKGEPACAYGVLDPAAFSSDGGPSIAERMARHGAFFRAADNARVARRGAMGGWDQVRGRLVGEHGRPMLYVFSTCVDLIRTLPALQHDKAKAEDVDTNLEDHAPDEARYACMSRPWIRTPEPQPEKKMLAVGEGNQVTLEDIWPRPDRRRDF